MNKFEFMHISCSANKVFVSENILLHNFLWYHRKEGVRFKNLLKKLSWKCCVTDIDKC